MRRPRYRWYVGLSLQLATAVILFGLWEGLARAGVLEEFFYSSPSSILGSLGAWMATGQLQQGIVVTVEEALAGYALGVVAGVVLGLALGTMPTVGRILEPFFSAFNAIPRMVLVPFLIIWVGLGVGSKIAAAALVVVLLVFFSVYAGVQAIDPKLIAHARLLGASRLGLYRYVYLPATLVWLVVGLRNSLGFAFSAALVAEYLGSQAGLGYLILQGQSLLRTREIFAGLVVTAAIVVLLDVGLRRVEGRASIWRLG